MNITIRKLAATLFITLLVSVCVNAQQSYSHEQFAQDFDCMWTGLRDSYVYFDKKETDWTRVRELYRPTLNKVKTQSDFISLVEQVLNELYDNHTSLNTNLVTSPRLVPTGLDLWAEWVNGRAIITQLRSGFSAEQSGLRVGMEIISINGVPIESAVISRLPKSLRTMIADARSWTLRACLAGRHDQPRMISAKDKKGVTADFKLDLPTQKTVDNYQYVPKVEWKMLPAQLGYIKLNDLISTEMVSQFDSALEGIKASHGLVLDLRDIPGGGNTNVAEPILGRLIGHRIGYQQVVPLHGASYIKEIVPSGGWTYERPIVVLVNRWTGSMGEGMAIGLDGMKRATVVGTRMAGLNGGIFSLTLPNTKISVAYAGEKLNHINGTPRENFAPPVFVNLMDEKLRGFSDPIYEVGTETLNKLIKQKRIKG